MTLKVGEIGKIININTGFDLSGNTELEMNFIKPDLTTLQKLTANGVTAPAVPFTDPDTGEVYAANEYASYPTASGDISLDGSWTVTVKYIDATPKEFCGDVASFTVLPCG